MAADPNVYLSLADNVAQLLARLQAGNNNHFGRDLEALEWGAVVDMARLRLALVRATDLAFGETQADRLV